MGRPQTSQAPGAIKRRGGRPPSPEKALRRQLLAEERAERQVNQERARLSGIRGEGRGGDEQSMEERARAAVDRERARVEGLRMAKQEMRRSEEHAAAQAKRAAKMAELMTPSEAEIKTLLAMTEEEFARWILQRILQISRLAEAAERPDFRAALAATLAIAEFVKQYREQHKTPDPLWLTEAVKEAEVEDVHGVEPGDGKPELPSDLPVASGEQDESGGAETWAPEATDLGDADDGGTRGDGVAEAMGEGTGTAPGLEPAVVDSCIPYSLTGVSTLEAGYLFKNDKLVEIHPRATDPLDWSTAIATATGCLSEPCPACMAVGMLTRGRVIDGIQWLNCGACGRTEVKSA